MESKIPLFEALGTPEEYRDHAVFDSGHNLPRHEQIRVMLNWLDRHFAAPKGRSVFKGGPES